MKDEDYLLASAGLAFLISRSKRTPKAPIPVMLVPPEQALSIKGGLDDEDFNRGVWTGVAVTAFTWYAWGRWVKPTALKVLGSGSRGF